MIALQAGDVSFLTPVDEPSPVDELKAAAIAFMRDTENRMAAEGRKALDDWHTEKRGHSWYYVRNYSQLGG